MQAPSYDGFDGGAGARYQARREIKSYWYPTWLSQLAAMVPNSKLIDAAPHGIGHDEVVTEATHYDLAVLHSSTPTFASDLKTAARLMRNCSARSAPDTPSGFARKAERIFASVVMLPPSSSSSSPVIELWRMRK